MNLRDFANRMLAAASLPTMPPPKAPSKQQTLPGYRRQIAPTTAAIVRPDRALANTDLLSFRTAATTNAVIRQLVAGSPDMSAAVSTYLRVGIPENYVVAARNMDGSVNPEATALAHQILRRWTYVPDYQLGFNSQASLQSLSETLGKELMMYGALAGEVVLDKARLPMQLVPVTVTNLRFYEDGNGIRPTQYIGGVDIDLDIPTFIYVSVDQDQLDAYPSSYLESAIQPILADADFTNDLRRVLKRAVHPRITATLIEDRIKKATPPEILNDPEKYAVFLNTLLSDVESVINGLNPEDALVGFDSVEYSYLDGAPNDMSGTFKAVQDLLNAKLATGAKTLPAILGHATTSNAASAEAMLYLKHADLLRRKLNEFYSRALTVSIRLFGQDAYVDFEYDKLDLRPDSELEAYKAMRQSRLTEQLSLGLLSDEEASLALTGRLPPIGFKPLSGTMFKSGSADVQNPASGTSTMNKTLKPDTPAAPKSQKKANVIPFEGAF